MVQGESCSLQKDMGIVSEGDPGVGILDTFIRCRSHQSPWVYWKISGNFKMESVQDFCTLELESACGKKI